jgi:hypothetical protein
MDDETLLTTMKNGLVIAGHEMGAVGDHWPAIRALCAGLDEEFELDRCNQAVLGEMEFHTAEAFRQLEEIAEEAEDEHDKAIIKAFVKEMWENYYAALEPVDAKCKPDIEHLILEDGSNAFPNMHAAVRILKGLLGGGRV